MQLDLDETIAFREQFAKSFPNLMNFIEDCKQKCRQRGYIKTIFGRIRRLSQINSEKPAERASAERKAVNSTVQGSASDLVKFAMLRVNAAIEAAKLDAIMILQLHDELFFEIRNGCALDAFVHLLRTEMSTVDKDLSVRLPVRIKAGLNWAELQEKK